LANLTKSGDDWAFTVTTTQAMSQYPNSYKGTEINVYDLAASTHMSPDRHRFTEFREIPPRSITAADKVIFNATGTGTMRIATPNGDKMSYITLTNVLYCKDLVFTLVLLC